MTIVLDLPQELESKLSAEASRHGVPLQDYVLHILSSSGRNPGEFKTGPELMAYWQQSGVVGTRQDISNSQEHARALRAEAEQRERP
jgi:hypothetical protein